MGKAVEALIHRRTLGGETELCADRRRPKKPAETVQNTKRTASFGGIPMHP